MRVVLSAVLGALAAGCVPPLYVASSAPVPLAERAGEVQLRAGAGAQGASGSAVVSPLPHALLFVGAESEAMLDSSRGGSRGRRVLGGGAGLYHAWPGGGRLELLAGAERGRVRTAGLGDAAPSDLIVRQSGRLVRSFVQADAGVVRPLSGGAEAAAGVSVRLARAAYHDYEETIGGEPQDVPSTLRATFVEPGAVFRYGFAGLSVEVTARYAFPLTRNRGISIEPSRTDFALALRVDRLLRALRGAP